MLTTRIITAMTSTTVFAATTILGAGLVAAEPAKVVKLNYRNGSKVDIQVYTVDNVLKKTIEKKNLITPGGSDSSQAEISKDGNIDILYSVVGKNDKGASEYRCKPIKTSASSATSTTVIEFEKLNRC